MTIPFLKSLSDHSARSGSEAGTTHPQRDWVLLLGVTLILFIALSAWSYLSFLRAVRADESSAVDAAAAATTGTSLEGVRAVFEERAAERARYQTERHFIDPSK